MTNTTTTNTTPTATMPAATPSGTSPNTLAQEHTMRTAHPHYQRPDWFTRNVFNRLVSGCTRLGVSVRGSRVLEHRGRSTGTLHHTPVNLLTIGGDEYLVAPRGETQWVRNVRHAGGRLVLILGRRRTPCVVREVPEADRVPILREYLRHWKFETGMFFGGVTAESSDVEWATEAARHPVFALG